MYTCALHTIHKYGYVPVLLQALRVARLAAPHVLSSHTAVRAAAIAAVAEVAQQLDAAEVRTVLL